MSASGTQSDRTPSIKARRAQSASTVRAPAPCVSATLTPTSVCQWHQHHSASASASAARRLCPLLPFALGTPLLSTTAAPRQPIVVIPACSASLHPISSRRGPCISCSARLLFSFISSTDKKRPRGLLGAACAHRLLGARILLWCRVRTLLRYRHCTTVPPLNALGLN